MSLAVNLRTDLAYASQCFGPVVFVRLFLLLSFILNDVLKKNLFLFIFKCINT